MSILKTKFVRTILSMVLCIALLCTTAFADASSKFSEVPGDVDGNGVKNLFDLVLLAQLVANWDVEYNPWAADVNGDGTVDADDIVSLAQNVAGWEVAKNPVITKPVTFAPTAKKIYNKNLVGGEFKFTLEGEINGAKISQEKMNSADGTITFDTLSFPKAGTYTFTVKEIDKLLGFIEYSAAEYELVVNVIYANDLLSIGSVTVNGDENGTIEFTNTYTIDGEDEVTLRGNTVLTGDRTEVKAEEFEFGLYDADGTLIESVKNDAAGNFAFSTLKFNENDTVIDGEKQFTYTVKEIAGNNARYEYDATVYTVVVTVADNDEGGVTASYTVNGEIKFTNTYTNPTPVTFAPNANKNYNKVLNGGEFKFALEGENNGVKVEQEKVNAADGTITFDVLSFPEAGTYTFTVKEIDKFLGFIEYSAAEHTLVVNVIDTNGVLSIESVTVNGDENGTIEFTNTYTIDGEDEVTLRGNTVLTGDRTEVKAEEFEFGLYGEDGTLIESVKNDVAGNFAFSTLKFNENDTVIDGEKQFTYTVKEIAGNNARYEYDATVYTVVVTVADNDQGGVAASYTVNGVANGEIKFTNRYTKPEPVEKFAIVFQKTDKFTYRLGNGNAVNLSSLFKAAEGIDANEISGVVVTATDSNANEVATYNQNAVWENGTLDFADDFTGIANITVNMPADDCCLSTTLTVEVVDAKNATAATNATANNVVLLNDAGFSSLDVKGGYTLYGNGFTLTCGSDSPALDTGYSFVTLENGTLDNVQIVLPNFDYAVLYKSNMEESGNRSQTTDRTRYYNVKSGVAATGNSQILNSRISGARAAVNVSGGNLLIDNSRIELGAVASLLVGAANSLTLRDVTLVQKPTPSTYDPNKVLMGFSTLFVCDANGDAAPVTIEGNLVQNAWVDESDKQYVPSAGQSIISTVLGKTEYLHDIDGDGTNESLNLGFAYMPESLTSKVNTTTITDNRTNKDSIPYDYAEVSIINGKTYVYSYKNANGTDASFKTESEYVPNKYGDIITVNYADTNENRVLGKVFGENGWVYQLAVDLDQGAYAFDFSKLTVKKNGVVLGIDRTDSVAVQEGTTEYTLTLTDGSTILFKVIGTMTTKDVPQWSNDANGSALSATMNASWEAGLCVASSHGGTWSGAAPALQNVYIRYYSTAEKGYKIIHLADYTPSVTGKVNGANTTCTITGPGFTLTLTGGQVHSGNKVNAIPVVCGGKLYFVAATSSGLVNTGNSARSVPVSYSFTDGFGNTLTGSHSWSVAENKDAEYSYNDFCNGTLTKLEASSGGSCVTPDTLITLADGSQKRVDSLTGDEMLLVWNLETGKYEAAPIVFVDSDAETEQEIIHLYFSNGSEVKVISEHGFFDVNLGKYVYIDATNYADYIGHTFVTEGDITSNSFNTATLENVVIEKEVTTAWSPVTFKHLCYYTNGVLSMPGGIDGLFNIFEVDTDTMRYDAEKMQKDIETYGLFTLEDFGGLVPEIAFEAFNGNYLKIAIAKGMLTWEDIAYLAERYVPLV